MKTPNEIQGESIEELKRKAIEGKDSAERLWAINMLLLDYISHLETSAVAREEKAFCAGAKQFGNPSEATLKWYFTDYQNRGKSE